MVISRIETAADNSQQLPANTLPAEFAESIVNPIARGWIQDGIALGLRWDFDFNMALKAQWDYKQVKADGMGLWFPNENGQYPTEDIDVHIVSATWDFVFWCRTTNPS